jgi:hypothetical protein
MICNVKTVSTCTFTCCQCGYKLSVPGNIPLEAEKTAKEFGWTEDEFKRPICDECSGEEGKP